MPSNWTPQAELLAARSRMIRATQAWQAAGGSDDAVVHELTDHQRLLMIEALTAQKAYASLSAARRDERTIDLR